MALSWPTTIPATADSWQEQDVDNILRTQTDAGPGKVRRKYTGVVSNISMNSVLTLEQVIALREFYRIDCQQGALRFSFPDPVTGVTTVYRWDGPPVFNNVGSLAFQCAMKWKQVPGDV